MSAATLSPRILELLRFAKAHYRHTEAMATATGARFNVFQILRIGHREVETHSPMLAELLNPLGLHGQGAVFLRLLLAQLGIADFDAESARVQLEHYAGAVTEKSGGRIDIRLCDRLQRVILLENKIYAGDQPNQVSRYRNFDPRAHLLYVTLDGNEPGNVDVKTVPGLKCLSYRNDILAWLRACRKEAACSPTVRETLTQYIHLIEELTDQSTTGKMNDELIQTIVADEGSLQAFFTLRGVEEEVFNALVARLERGLDDLARELKVSRVGEAELLSSKFAGFGFTTPGLTQRGLVIRFEFDARGYRELFFGFKLQNPKLGASVREDLGRAFYEHFPKSDPPSEEWPAWTWWEEYREWRAKEFEAIRSGQFLADLKATLQKLVTVAHQVCPPSKR